MAEVSVSIGGQQITSIITARSAREMQLKPGQTAAALIKATSDDLARLNPAQLLSQRAVRGAGLQRVQFPHAGRKVSKSPSRPGRGKRKTAS
jgi:TOBE domain-containing protein